MSNQLPRVSHAIDAPAAPHGAEVDAMIVLAHDLRNYLTPVYTHLTILHKRAQHEQRARDVQTAARGRQALEYGLLLISNMVEAARFERGLFDLITEPTDVSALVQQAIEVFEMPQHPLVLSMPEVVVARVDQVRVRQVLHNLLANAMTYSPRDVPITVEVRTEQRACGSWGVIRICNSGPAIPALQLPGLFQRFAAGPDSQGLGLGLYLARGIAESHGGTLTVSSDDETGTCFVLALPLAASNSQVNAYSNTQGAHSS